ncbi:hypothetical protein CWATWH0005_4180 [Crocosphaera watsonii WH 0005]|uniref:Uncharacterized protein n=1 Tax=Crocosphaera watsonii WH 0005 TaxID=423472 RepID=T2IM96_CROWT|nr:hypothetical protein CWATWH0005_4180 [Crocosphaera watsonii WH 0005]
MLEILLSTSKSFFRLSQTFPVAFPLVWVMASYLHSRSVSLMTSPMVSLPPDLEHL